MGPVWNVHLVLIPHKSQYIRSDHVFTTVLMSQFDVKLTRYYFSDMTMNIILISLN